MNDRIPMDTHLLKRGLVYVVDDDETARRFAHSMLYRLGWRVLSFADADSFVRAYTSFPPEAAVLDISLPQSSGAMLAVKLRRYPRTASMRLVAYTGLPNEEFQELLCRDFDAVIQKPGSLMHFAQALPVTSHA